MSVKEVKTRSQRLETLYAEISASLDQIETGQSANPKEDIKKLAPSVKEFFQNLESLKMAYRDLPDVDRQQNRKKFKQYKAMYVGILNKIKEASNKASRHELLAKDGPDNGQDDDSTEDKYIQQGEDLLDSNKQILTHTLDRVHEARQLGESGVDKLRAQNEQIARMDDSLDQMSSSLEVSKRIISQMARRMAMDKMLWVMILLLVIAIVFLIVLTRLT